MYLSSCRFALASEFFLVVSYSNQVTTPTSTPKASASVEEDDFEEFDALVQYLQTV